MRNYIKDVATTEQKEKHYVRQIIHTKQGDLPTKSTPAIEPTDELIIPYVVSVVENTLVDDCK